MDLEIFVHMPQHEIKNFFFFGGKGCLENMTAVVKKS